MLPVPLAYLAPRMVTMTPSIVALDGIEEKSKPVALRTRDWSPLSNVAAVTEA